MFGSFDHCGWKTAHKKQIHRQNPKFGSEFSQALGHVAKNHKRQRSQMGKTLESKWETLRHLGHWDTPKGGARKIEKSGKVESPGWSECTCDTAVIPVGYLCTHCVPLKLESESTSGAVQASQSWPRRCLQRSHCPTDWCRLCCWHCLGSLAPLKPS